jgi:hypothetical protein
MSQRRIFHPYKYSYIQGGSIIALATVVGWCAGFAFGTTVVQEGLTPEQFGHEVAPYTLFGIVVGFSMSALIEYTRWHYSRR